MFLFHILLPLEKRSHKLTAPFFVIKYMAFPAPRKATSKNFRFENILSENVRLNCSAPDS